MPESPTAHRLAVLLLAAALLAGAAGVAGAVSRHTVAVKHDARSVDAAAKPRPKPKRPRRAAKRKPCKRVAIRRGARRPAKRAVKRCRKPARKRPATKRPAHAPATDQAPAAARPAAPAGLPAPGAGGGPAGEAPTNSPGSDSDPTPTPEPTASPTPSPTPTPTPPPDPHISERSDWVLVELAAGAADTAILVPGATASAERSGDRGPVHVVAMCRRGVATIGATPNSEQRATYYGAEAKRVQTTGDAGGRGADLPEELPDRTSVPATAFDPGPLDEMTLTWGPGIGCAQFKAGERTVYLAFITNATFTDFRFAEPEPAAGQQPGGVTIAKVRHGTGSRTVWTAGADQSGVGAGSTWLSAGTSAQAFTTGDGLVGLIANDCSRALCRVDWTTPSGSGGMVRSLLPLQAGSEVIAGAPGCWTFQYTGVATGSALAVLAPVGADWQRFPASSSVANNSPVRQLADKPACPGG